MPATSGRTPKLDGSNSGAQFVPLRNVQSETSLKNSIAGNEERDDDPDRGQDRDERAQGEDDLDDVLAPAPAGGTQPDCACGNLLRRQPTAPSYLS